MEKVLIVCTKSSLLSFTNDILKTNYDPNKLIVIREKDDLKAIRNSANKLFLIQYETLQQLNILDLKREFKAFSSGIFIDECHKVKTLGQKKKRFTAEALGFIKPAFEIVVGLTATSMTSKLEDSYRVISFIRPKCLGGYQWFCNTFCIVEEQQVWNKKLKKYITYPKIKSYKNLNKFKELTKDVVIQFFPKLDYRFKILSKSLPEGSKREIRYNELAAQTHGRNNSKHSSIMPKLQRLIDKSATKKLLFKRIIEKTRDTGLIVFTQTRKSNMVEYIQSILEEEGMDVRVVSGSTKVDKRKEIVEWGFEGDPKNKAVVITTAGGQSLNLHFTNNLMFFEIPRGIGPYLQVKGRIGRMFSKHKYYNFYFALVKNTIDEYFFERFCSFHEVLGEVADNSAIPLTKLNKFDNRKLKKLRDQKVWRKGKEYQTYQQTEVTKLKSHRIKRIR